MFIVSLSADRDLSTLRGDGAGATATSSASSRSPQRSLRPGAWQVFGLSDQGAAKRGRRLALLTVNIPALNSSPHLKEFFQGWGGDTAFQGVQGLAHPATPSDPHTAP